MKLQFADRSIDSDLPLKLNFLAVIAISIIDLKF